MPENNPALDRVCRVLTPTSSSDADGGPVVGFAQSRPIWCHKSERGGAETRTSGAKRFEGDAMFQFRWSFFPSLTTKHRILCEGVTYEIDAIAEGGRRQWWRVTAARREGMV